MAAWLKRRKHCKRTVIEGFDKEDNDMKKKMMIAILSTAVLLTACAQTVSGDRDTSETAVKQTGSSEVSLEQLGSVNSDTDRKNSTETDTTDLFTDRDMQQTPDLTDAEYITVSDGKDITIDSEGVYVISGNAQNVTVFVEADDQDKVQLVMDGLNISNTDSPCIYVKSADKVFITTTSDSNELTVSGSFTSDGDTNTDAVIFSKDDLVFNGKGTLNISSSDNGISGKDDVKLTGGTIKIACSGSAIEAHDEILIADGNIDITECNDGLHAEDDDDDTTGYIYIAGGTINIKAADDGIHATTTVMIDAGDMVLTAAEGIEGTQIVINGGNISITASDDGINAAKKSSSLTPLFELNGGDVSITMGAGDTDGVDSNGDIFINGGTISINGQSTFDYDGKAEYNGGTIIENGQETDTITNQMFGERGAMGPGAGFGGQGGRVEGFEGNGEPPEGFGENGEPPEGFEGKGGPWEGFEGMPPEGSEEGGRGRGRRSQDNSQNGQNTQNSQNSQL